MVYKEILYPMHGIHTVAVEGYTQWPVEGYTQWLWKGTHNGRGRIHTMAHFRKADTHSVRPRNGVSEQRHFTYNRKACITRHGGAGGLACRILLPLVHGGLLPLVHGGLLP